METGREPIPPRAAACIAHEWRFAEPFSAHRCLAFTGFMSGLTLGLALSRIDPEWAQRAYDELIEHQSAIWGRAGMPPQRKRLESWKEAQHLIQMAGRDRPTGFEAG